MNKYYAGCLVALWGLGMGLCACSSDIEDEPQVEEAQRVTAKKVVFNVGELPSEQSASSRAEEDESYLKHSWTVGDVIFLEVTVNEDNYQYYQLEYASEENTWTLYKLLDNDDKSKVSEEEISAAYSSLIGAKAIYAPGYSFSSNYDGIEPNGAAGFSEYLTTSIGKGGETEDTQVLNIQFTRTYSRLRIHTGMVSPQNFKIDTNFSTSFTTAAGGTNNAIKNQTPDANGNVFIYGRFKQNCAVTVTIKNSSDQTLGTETKTFTSNSEANTSYLFELQDYTTSTSEESQQE